MVYSDVHGHHLAAQRVYARGNLPLRMLESATRGKHAVVVNLGDTIDRGMDQLQQLLLHWEHAALDPLGFYDKGGNHEVCISCRC